MKKLIIKMGKSNYVIDMDDIDFIRTERNYSQINCGDRKYISCKPSRYFEGILDSQIFKRISKSTIVNINRINEFKQSDQGDYIVKLSNNIMLKWGRKYRDKLSEFLRI